MNSIKKAGFDELPVIHDLAYRIWPQAYGDILSAPQLKFMLEEIYSLASLQNQFVALGHNFVLIRNNDIPVGFASFSPKEENGTTYRLHKIYVLPEQQGTGAGKLLLMHVINSIKSLGAASLELNVNRYNKARLFYEKQGFVITSEEDIDIGQGFFMNDYVMRLTLTDPA